MKCSLRYSLLLAILLGCFHQGICQQQVQFTQYMFNQLPLNPAYAGAGAGEGLQWSTFYRNQWVGFEGAPETFTFTIQTPLSSYRNIAGGLVVVQDQLGFTTTQMINPVFAYFIRLKNGARLSFGGQLGLIRRAVDYGQSPLAINDGTLQNGSETRINFGSGIMFRSKKYYVGIGIPQLIEQEYQDGSNGIQHLFATAGYSYPLRDDIIFHPSVLIKQVEGAPAQFDLNAFFELQMLGVGFAYRSSANLSAILQIPITFGVNNLQLGYAFDLTTNNDIREASRHSHEIMLTFFRKPGPRFTPRKPSPVGFE